MRKGVYPYEYMDSKEKFNETFLPDRSALFSSISDQSISQSDDDHAKIVWKMSQISNMGGYHDLFMEPDVILLVDVFKNFRDLCFNIYGLDPAHFYTAPELALQAALKMTKSI